tara:strand:- start:39 stop:1091 length:1053 start_codon:yes stop_codon:yes gene_type:complete
MTKFLHIGGDSRSGGSLLARLFDGCENILSFPFESEYFQNRNHNLIKFDKFFNSLEIDDLYELEVVAKMIKFGEGVLTGKQHYSKDLDNFDVERFKNKLEMSIKTTDNIYDVLHKTYFEELLWPTSLSWPAFEEIEVVVNHCSRTFISDLSEYYENFQNGYFVQTIRSPLSAIASMKAYSFARESKYIDMPDFFIDIAIQRWLIALYVGLQNNECYSKYKILFYEELVESPEGLKEVCKFIDIPFHEDMLVPKYRNKVWHGNSSFGKREPKLSNENRDKYKEILTNSEVKKINDLLGYIWEEVLEYGTDSQQQCREKLKLFNKHVDFDDITKIRNHYNMLFNCMRNLQKR